MAGSRVTVYVGIPDDSPDIESACREAVRERNERLRKRGFYHEWVFVKIIRRDRAKGIDGYGKYYDFTGHEEKHRCFWCGEEIKRGRYCCEEHKRQYNEHFHWVDARFACIRRSTVGEVGWQRRVRCQDCGDVEIFCTEIHHVHHITPMDGEQRGWHWLNRPENLVLLCSVCHKIRHVELNYLMKKARTLETEIKKEREQTVNKQQLSLFREGVI